MFRKSIHAGLLCLLISLACGSCAADDNLVKKRIVIMGGYPLGFRAFSKQNTQSIFNLNLKEISGQIGTGIAFSTVIYNDSRSLLSGFDKGEIDGFFGTPLEYLSRKDRLCKIIAGVEFNNSLSKQRILIVGRADNGRMQLKDLRNKRLTLAPYLDVEELYLNTVLMRNKLPEIPEYFSARKDAQSANIALMDVFFNKSDVTVVRENDYNTAVELNPQISRKLVVLDKSEPYMTMVAVVSKSFSEDDFKLLINTFSRAINTDQGKKLMDIVAISDVEMVTHDDMKNLQELIRENASLKKGRRNLVYK
jgi:ABC-type phosphate/phosphonate transport system substrate-binding protein